MDPDTRERFLTRYGIPGQQHPIFAALVDALRDAAIYTAPRHARLETVKPRYRRDKLESVVFTLLVCGRRMEETAEMVQIAQKTLEESRATLQTLKNEIDALSEHVQPALVSLVTNLRTARMSAVAEIRESLTALHDIRKFFLESEYETEMRRLERFVGVCREIQALKRDGTFDSVCDSVLRLAVGDRS